MSWKKQNIGKLQQQGGVALSGEPADMCADLQMNQIVVYVWMVSNNNNNRYINGLVVLLMSVIYI